MKETEFQRGTNSSEKDGKHELVHLWKNRGGRGGCHREGWGKTSTKILMNFWRPRIWLPCGSRGRDTEKAQPCAQAQEHA